MRTKDSRVCSRCDSYHVPDTIHCSHCHDTYTTAAYHKHRKWCKTIHTPADMAWIDVTVDTPHGLATYWREAV